MPISVYGVDYLVNPYTGLVLAQEVFRAASDFGTAAHEMMKLYFSDQLDEGSLHPSLAPVLSQIKAWASAFRPVILGLETPMYSASRGFAGTPDILCKIKRVPYIIDLKTGAYDMVGPQTAAYEKLWQPCRRACLSVKKDGSAFKFIPLNNPRDWGFFQSKLYEYNYLQEVNS